MGNLSGTYSLSSEWSFLFFISGANPTSDPHHLLLLCFGTSARLEFLILDFPGGPVDKNSLADGGDKGSIPGLGRFHMGQSNWSLCVLEPALHRERIHHNKPMHHNEKYPPLAATGGKPIH